MAESPYASWNNMAHNLAYVCWAVGILIVLGYIVRLSTVSDNKDKYDFINRYEVNFLWYASLILILGACFYFNGNIFEITTIMYFVRGFLTVMMGIIVALIVQRSTRAESAWRMQPCSVRSPSGLQLQPVPWVCTST